jgi:hypothetical protein
MLDEIEIGVPVEEFGRTIHEGTPILLGLLAHHIGMGASRISMQIHNGCAGHDVLQCGLTADIVARNEGTGVILVDQALARGGDHIIAPGLRVLDFDFNRTAQDTAKFVDFFRTHFEAALELDAVRGADW